jgi:GNAT superfamily N-acetyltransferase
VWGATAAPPRWYVRRVRTESVVAQYSVVSVSQIIRLIDSKDVAAVASVHAASWRAAYRGMLREDFLNGDLDANRAELWKKRLTPLPQEHFGFLAIEAQRPIGFSFAFGAHDARWGTLVDNLHVLPEFKGRGLGRRLLTHLCEQAHAAHPDIGLYLWVYEQNSAARAFYDRLGGECAERAVIEAPGGGEVAEWRYVWPNAKRVLAALKT